MGAPYFLSPNQTPMMPLLTRVGWSPRIHGVSSSIFSLLLSLNFWLIFFFFSVERATRSMNVDRIRFQVLVNTPKTSIFDRWLWFIYIDCNSLFLIIRDFVQSFVLLILFSDYAIMWISLVKLCDFVNRFFCMGIRVTNSPILEKLNFEN